MESVQINLRNSPNKLINNKHICTEQKHSIINIIYEWNILGRTEFSHIWDIFENIGLFFLCLIAAI